MVRFHLLFAALVFRCTIPSLAQATVFVDLLDPSDGGQQPPPDVLVVDMFVDVAVTDVWTAAGVGVTAYDGARIRYTRSDDPNYPWPLLTNPGLENRFVCFASSPRDRFEDRRFTDGEAALSGTMLCYQPPFVTARPTRLDFLWFAWPPAGPSSPSVDGAILRIALDVGAACNPSTAAVCLASEPPPGFVPLMLAHCSNISVPGGTVVSTYDIPAGQYLVWGIYIDARETCTGDANRDGAVEIEDLALLLSAFGTNTQYNDEGFSHCSDFDGNGRIDLADLQAVLLAFGTYCGG